MCRPHLVGEELYAQLAQLFLFSQFWPIDVSIEKVMSGINCNPFQHRVYGYFFCTSFFPQSYGGLKFCDFLQISVVFVRFP